MKTLAKASIHLAVVAGFAMCLNGCSKAKEQAEVQPAAAPETAPQQTSHPAAQAATVPSAPVRLENVAPALQRKDYDAAVDMLLKARVNAQQANAEQKALYLEQQRATAEALANAMATDPRAKAAYERLGRAVKGR